MASEYCVYLHILKMYTTGLTLSIMSTSSPALSHFLHVSIFQILKALLRLKVGKNYDQQVCRVHCCHLKLYCFEIDERVYLLKSNATRTGFNDLMT